MKRVVIEQQMTWRECIKQLKCKQDEIVDWINNFGNEESVNKTALDADATIRAAKDVDDLYTFGGD